MRVGRKKFVLWAIAIGIAYSLATRLLLDQPPDALWATPGQAAWQQGASTLLAPVRIVLAGPVLWLQQDPDPPPPLRFLLLAAWWSLLALAIHWLLSRRRGEG